MLGHIGVVVKRLITEDSASDADVNASGEGSTERLKMRSAATPSTGPTVAVIGESVVDMVVSSTGRMTVLPGGSPLNVAVGLARLGVPTELATRIGDDANGWLTRRHLADAGVTLHPGSTNAARTATSRASIGADGTATYDFDITWDLRSVRVRSPSIVHTGSVATILEPGASRVAQALRTLPHGTLVTFDPNVRPSLCPPREPTRERVERIAALAHVVKMSDEDADWLYPGRTTAEIAERYAALGVAMFILTRGAQGCTVASGDFLRELPAETTTVVDTIGAGDSFMSGLIYEISRSGAASGLMVGEHEIELLDRCVRTGLRTAAITVSRAGANPPSRNELDDAGRCL